MIKKPVRLYSDFANPRERAVVMALERKTANLKIMAELDPDWSEERRIIAIRAGRARKWMARNFLKNVEKEDKLMAAYERQLKARRAKSKNSQKSLKKVGKNKLKTLSGGSVNFNDAAIDKFKAEIKTEIRDEIVKALSPRFDGIDENLKKANGRLEIVEKHMGRHCKEIQKLELTIKSQGRTLRSHRRFLESHHDALKKLTKEE